MLALLKRLLQWDGRWHENWGIDVVKQMQAQRKRTYLMVRPDSGWPPEQYRVESKEQRDAFLERGWLWVAGGVVPARSTNDEMADAKLSG